jgi:uncharacterized membrane protein
LHEDAKRADLRRQSYDHIQTLTFFVISIELVTCGYMLLNADRLAGLPWARWLFLAVGIAALAGILWRFGYNEAFYRSAVGRNNRWGPLVNAVQTRCHHVFAVVSLVSLVALLIAGTMYIGSPAVGSRPPCSCNAE